MKPLLPQGKELKRLAEELGVSTQPGSDASAAGTVLEPALQARVREALNLRASNRAYRLSKIALAVSIISALCAVAPLVWSWWRGL